MSDRGFIAVDRDVFDHPVFAPEPFTEREAWIWLIAEAAWSDRRVRVGSAVVDVARGQVVHSLRFMAAKWRWSEARVRRYLARLKNDAMLDASATQKATQITICNFDKYQSSRRTDVVTTDADSDAQATQNNTREQDNYTGYSAGDAREDAANADTVERDHNALSRYLIEAGGKAIVNPASAPGLLILSDPMNWIRNGCDLHADILPTIRARCSNARPSSIRSWSYFTKAIFEARDTRLKPAPEPINDRPHNAPRRPTSSADTMLAAFAGVAARSSGDGGHEGDYPPRFDDGRTIDLVANRH